MTEHRKLLSDLAHAQNQYNSLRNEEISDLMDFALANGWASSRSEEGKELQARIALLANQLKEQSSEKGSSVLAIEGKAPPEEEIRPDILLQIREELTRAKSLHPIWPENDLIHASAIVVEEAGELVRSVLQKEEGVGSIEEIRKEAVQTATMAIRFLQNL